MRVSPVTCLHLLLSGPLYVVYNASYLREFYCMASNGVVNIITSSFDRLSCRKIDAWQKFRHCGKYRLRCTIYHPHKRQRLTGNVSLFEYQTLLCSTFKGRKCVEHYGENLAKICYRVLNDNVRD